MQLDDVRLALVTGATGFVGAQLCRALTAEGVPVRAFHRAGSSLAGLAGLPVEHAVGDLTQPLSLQAAMQGVEVVFHTAAQLGSPHQAGQMYAVTVEGTRHVLQAAASAGVCRVVHTSSVAALGVPSEAPAGHALLMDERHTWNFRPEWWRYGHAKYLAELEVQAAVARGLDVVMVNPAVVVGPGDLNRVSGDVIVQVARRRIPAAVPGGLNVIHIKDVVRGHLAALVAGRCGERYILANENLAVLDFLKLIAKITGVRAPRLVLPAGLVRQLAGPVSALERRLPMPVGGDLLHKAGYYFYYDNSKAHQELGLDNLKPAHQAIEAAFQWYRARGDC